MLRTIWGDDDRYVETYWSRFKDTYFAGDGAKKDDDGDIWLLGRVDDVMNVSGHRISTTEVESALSQPGMEEAVVGATDPDDGSGHRRVRHLARPVPEDESEGDAVAKELRAHVAKEIRADRQAAATVAGAAEDAVGQDHAPAAARRGRSPRARRRDHADRLVGDGPDFGEAAERLLRGLTPSPRCGRMTGCPHAGARAC